MTLSSQEESLLGRMHGDAPLSDAEEDADAAAALASVRRHFQLDGDAPDPVRHHRRSHHRGAGRAHPKRVECRTHADCEQGGAPEAGFALSVPWRSAVQNRLLLWH